MTPTRGDVIAAVHARFPGRDAATVLAVLDTYGTEPSERERERVQLAIIALCEGSEEKLGYLVRTAKTDYRDILCWAQTGPLSESEGEKLRQAALALIERWGKK
jgi:hypothetical protein